MKMLRFKKYTSLPDFWPLLVVIFFGLLAGKGLIGSGYFNMHDDLQMMRQLEMEKCFLDGQIPCRWVPDMGYGFGYPLFNFYPPLPYLVGQGIRLIGYSFVSTIKILFILSFVVSGITMYFLAREFFGRFGGVVSAVFYIWAPYHAVDVYVRGAMNEAWALMWFPLIFWAGYRLITSPTMSHKYGTSRDTTLWIIGLTVSWFALFTSHNLMVIVLLPFFAIWCLVWVIYSRNFLKVIPLAISGLWAFCLAAFFSLPVLLEKGLVQTDSLVVGYYEYTAHFASIGQLLFSRFWGYGPSVWMTQDDGMSFQVGWIHWGLSLLLLILVVSRFIKNRKIDSLLLVTCFFVAIGWLSAFMAHPRSTPLWGLVNELKFVQFPWRFLTIVIFGFGFAAGSITYYVKNKVLIVILLFSVLLYSWNYFLPEHGKLGPLSDEEKFSGAAWELQQTAGIYDYLPNTAITAPKAPRERIVDFISGGGSVSSFVEGTNWSKVKLNARENSLIRINIMDFPEWKVFLDDKEIATHIPESEEWGRMYVNIPAGDHVISTKLSNTPVRIVGNLISFFSWITLIILLYRWQREPSR